MKIQLDTKKKTIKIENDVPLNKFIKNLKKLLPNGEWKEYTLVSNVTITDWTYPTTIKERDLPPNSWCWYTWSGSYNIEV